MRDNWNMDELSDQAWNQMREMLDQEMPVQGSSRKPIVFWWFWMAAAVLLIGMIGFFWLRPGTVPGKETALIADAEHPREQLSEKRKVPVDQKPLSEQAMPQVITEEERTSTQKNGKGSVVAQSAVPQQEGAIVEQEGHAKYTGQATKNSALVRPPATVETFAEPENSIPQVTNELLEFPDEAANQEEAVVQQELENTPSPDHVEKTLARFIIEDLPASDIAALDQRPLSLSQISEHYPKKPLFLPLEINAGLITGSGFGGMTELRTGLYLTKSNRWTLQTGVGFRLQQAPFRISRKRSNDDVQSDAAEQPTTGSGNLDTNDPGQGGVNVESLSKAVASSDIDVRTLYADIPVVLDWQLARHWSIGAGIRMSWLLSTVWKEAGRNESLSFSGGGNFNLALSNSNRQYAIYPTGSNNIPTTLTLSDFYTSGTLGVTFRPNAKWNVRLQYQHSLTNQLDNPNYQKTDRSLWLSAGLRF